MATTTDVSSKIIQALAEYLKRDASSITPTHHLREDLGLDSMAVIEMLYRIEEVFNLQIPDQDLVGLTTVGHVIAYVEGRVAPASTKTAAKGAAKPSAKTPAKPAAKKPAAKPSPKSKKA
ncbi:MAG: acyl carrier protein [Nitrospira sp.]|nr:acyl carrier protein [Nitrospira sp.]HMU31331.1 acyl carrier protein [Nitrospira sp.]HMV56443.1 acyl carrier protein [Nitrospira sp.]HMZ98450.1 acyl carrier protein [Nitrospira sp.]HNA83953.1 acyl carrier protein [Nitrospira sp.]